MGLARELSGDPNEGTAHQGFDPQVTLENHWLLTSYKMMVDILQSKKRQPLSPSELFFYKFSNM